MLRFKFAKQREAIADSSMMSASAPCAEQASPSKTTGVIGEWVPLSVLTKAAWGAAASAHRQMLNERPSGEEAGSAAALAVSGSTGAAAAEAAGTADTDSTGAEL